MEMEIQPKMESGSGNKMENGEYYQRGKMEGGRWNVESEKWKLDVRPGLP